MSIAVEIGLLSSKIATVTAGLDEVVQTLSRRAPGKGGCCSGWKPTDYKHRDSKRGLADIARKPT